MFKDLSLRMKLILGFFVMIAFCSILGWRSITNMDDLNSQISQLRVEQFKPTKLLSNANVNLLAWNRSLLSFSQANNEQVRKSELDNMVSRREGLKKGIEELEAAPLSNRAMEHISSLKSQFKKTKVHEEHVLSLVEEGKNNEASSVIQKEIVPITQDMDLTMDQLTNLQTRQFEKAVQASDATYAQAREVMFLVIGISLVVGILLTVFISRSIINPFRNVFQGLSSFSARELEGLSDSFNKIVDDLKSGAEQVNAASSQISDASQILSSSSNEQASSIEENSSSLEEISGMVEKNVTSSEESDGLSSEVGKRMEKLVSAMGELKESNSKIQGLVNVIGEIGEKTKVIDEIVFQTKMLSFNASVEAERAGEHGRGFAIVAQEVGNLAEMSGKAAMEISNIVKDSIQQAEGITNENAQRVETGNELAQFTLDQSQKLSDTARQISVASKEQSKGINQVNETLANLSKSTQELSTTAEETASSSEELNGQAECLNAVVEQMMTVLRGGDTNTVDTPKVTQSSSTKEKQPQQNDKVLSFNKKESKKNSSGSGDGQQDSGKVSQGEPQQNSEEDVDKYWDAL